MTGRANGPSLLVVGSGIAGLTAALDAAEAGLSVTLVTKAELNQSNTRYAQGGVAVVVDDLVDAGAPHLGDSVASHVHDTLVAGAGLSDRAAVEILCAEGPAAIDRLIARGVPFDRHDGVLSTGLEAAHAVARILHAGGDATGAGIAHALADRVRDDRRIEVRERTTVLDLLVASDRVVGVRLLDGSALRADAVLLATGGAGQLYSHTTNPEVATADGVALALRAGAAVADLEFFQFHPTALATGDSFLVTEAVRGEGGVLLDAHGRRFMIDVHPDAELAPRDVVARAIARQMAADGGQPVRLDAAALGARRLAERFPTIDRACRERGLDWSQHPIPVTPAAHYLMGGVRTDLWGRTGLPGLLAVGEVACTGAQGANRLASNSLLEGAVFASRAIRGLLEQPAVCARDRAWDEPSALAIVEEPDAGEVSRSDLQHVMWEHAGLARDAGGLGAAAEALAGWRSPEVIDAKSAEDANLLLVARVLVAAASARTESRGAHFRADHPDPDPSQARHRCWILTTTEASA